MRHFAAATMLSLVLFGLVGCGASGPEGLIQERIARTNEMADILESDASQEEVEAKMEEFKAHGDEVRKKLDELPEEEKKRLGEKYEPQLTEAMSRMMNAAKKRRGW